MVHNGHKGHTNGYLLRFLMMKKGTQWGHNRGTKGTQRGHNRAQRDTTGHNGGTMGTQPGTKGKTWD